MKAKVSVVYLHDIQGHLWCDIDAFDKTIPGFTGFALSQELTSLFTIGLSPSVLRKKYVVISKSMR